METGAGGEPSPLIKYVLKKQAPPLPVCTRCCLPAFLAGPGLQTLFFQMPMGERPAPRAEANRQAQHRLIGHHITNDTHRGMLISVSRPSSAARSSLLSSGVSARPEVQKLVYQMPMFTEIPGDRGPREQTQHRSIIRGYINAQTEVLKSSLMERASSYPFHYYYMH